MVLKFANGAQLNLLSYSEKKCVYSVPHRWELELFSDTDISSDEIDVLLKNTQSMTVESGGENTAELNGYNKIDSVRRTVTECVTGAAAELKIKLYREVLTDEYNV